MPASGAAGSAEWSLRDSAALTGTSSRIISPLRLEPALISYSRFPPGSSNWTLIDSRFTRRFTISTISLDQNKKGKAE